MDPRLIGKSTEEAAATPTTIILNKNRSFAAGKNNTDFKQNKMNVDGIGIQNVKKDRAHIIEMTRPEKVIMVVNRHRSHAAKSENLMKNTIVKNGIRLKNADKIINLEEEHSVTGNSFKIAASSSMESSGGYTVVERNHNLVQDIGKSTSRNTITIVNPTKLICNESVSSMGNVFSAASSKEKIIVDSDCQLRCVAAPLVSVAPATNQLVFLQPIQNTGILINSDENLFSQSNYKSKNIEEINKQYVLGDNEKSESSVTSSSLPSVLPHTCNSTKSISSDPNKQKLPQIHDVRSLSQAEYTLVNKSEGKRIQGDKLESKQGYITLQGGIKIKNISTRNSDQVKTSETNSTNSAVGNKTLTHFKYQNVDKVNETSNSSVLVNKGSRSAASNKICMPHNETNSIQNFDRKKVSESYSSESALKQKIKRYFNTEVSKNSPLLNKTTDQNYVVHENNKSAPGEEQLINLNQEKLVENNSSPRNNEQNVASIVEREKSSGDSSYTETMSKCKSLSDQSDATKSSKTSDILLTSTSPNNTAMWSNIFQEINETASSILEEQQDITRDIPNTSSVTTENTGFERKAKLDDDDDDDVEFVCEMLVVDNNTSNNDIEMICEIPSSEEQHIKNISETALESTDLQTHEIFRQEVIRKDSDTNINEIPVDNETCTSEVVIVGEICSSKQQVAVRERAKFKNNNSANRKDNENSGVDLRDEESDPLSVHYTENQANESDVEVINETSPKEQNITNKRDKCTVIINDSQIHNVNANFTEGQIDQRIICDKVNEHEISSQINNIDFEIIEEIEISTSSKGYNDVLDVCEISNPKSVPAQSESERNDVSSIESVDLTNIDILSEAINTAEQTGNCDVQTVQEIPNIVTLKQTENESVLKTREARNVSVISNEQLQCATKDQEGNNEASNSEPLERVASKILKTVIPNKNVLVGEQSTKTPKPNIIRKPADTSKSVAKAKVTSNLPTGWNALQQSLAGSQGSNDSNYKIIVLKTPGKKKLTYKDIVNVLEKENLTEERTKKRSLGTLTKQAINQRSEQSEIAAKKSKNHDYDKIVAEAVGEEERAAAKPHYRCVYCNETLIGNDNLLLHQTSVHKDKVFVCTLCEPNLVFYESKHFYSQHLAMYHSENKKSKLKNSALSKGTVAVPLAHNVNNMYFPSKSNSGMTHLQTKPKNKDLLRSALEDVKTSSNNTANKAPLSQTSSKASGKSAEKYVHRNTGSSHLDTLSDDDDDVIIVDSDEVNESSLVKQASKEAVAPVPQDSSAANNDSDIEIVSECDAHSGPKNSNIKQREAIKLLKAPKGFKILKHNIQTKIMTKLQRILNKSESSKSLRVVVSTDNGKEQIVKRQRYVLPARKLKHLKKNISIKSHKKIYTCSICGVQLQGLKRIQSHEEKHSKEKAPPENYICEICGAVVRKKESLKLHLQTHNDPIYHCEECNKMFRMKQLLATHVKAVHIKEETSFLCDICGKELRHKSNLVKHRYAHLHPGNLKRFPCEICDKKFSSRSKLQDHVNFHNNDKPYKCSLCPQTFSRRANLRSHFSVHTGIRKFQCEVCKISFRLNKARRAHYKTKAHFNMKNNICRFCEIPFESQDSLHLHIAVHEAEKNTQPEMCSICFKMLSNKNKLSIHMSKVHSGPKPHVCDICRTFFTSETCLNVHYQEHTSKNQLNCTYCGAGIASKSSLLIHERLHTGEKPFHCNVCYKAFRCQRSLTKHKERHGNTSTYNCNVCNSRFNQCNELTDHMLTHTTEHSFCCQVCSQRFSQFSDCKEHEKSHIASFDTVIEEDILYHW